MVWGMVDQQTKDARRNKWDLRWRTQPTLVVADDFKQLASYRRNLP